MWDLTKHEKLEMEILDGLNSIKVLPAVIFCGGTMLRLCHELNRYSVDLDFWLADGKKEEMVYEETKKFLKEKYELRRSRNTKESILFEINQKGYIRSVKIEFIKTHATIKYEDKIAFSKHSNIQVLVKGATLETMMDAKLKTLISRAQIRDAFDIEFLLRKGVKLEASKKELMQAKNIIHRFKPRDYTVTLGSLLNFKERQYYKTAKFRYLAGKIDEAIGGGKEA